MKVCYCIVVNDQKWFRPKFRQCPPKPKVAYSPFSAGEKENLDIYLDLGAVSTRVIAREKQRKQVGGGAIADGEMRAKNASGNGPLWQFLTLFGIRKPQKCSKIAQTSILGPFLCTLCNLFQFPLIPHFFFFVQ
jgi:hypothetical protein